VPPVLEQSTYSTVAKYQTRVVTATFNTPTRPGSLIVAVCSAAGSYTRLSTPAGFTPLDADGLRDIQQYVWYRQASPSISAVSATALDNNASLQLRVLEYSGIAQANAVDKLTTNSDEDDDIYAGNTGTTSQADELVLAFVTNQYASTAQYGFSGNLTRLYESTSPQQWWGGWNQDWEQSRLTVHQAIATTTGNFGLQADMSTYRRYVTTLVSFRGGSSGPARFTSVRAPKITNVTGLAAGLTVFGPLVSKTAPGMVTTSNVQARIGPSNYQYRIGGWSGLLIGSGTDFLVESTDGLNGWQVRTSDSDLPRGDGALRGIDLSSARQVTFQLSAGAGRDDTERNMDALYRAMIPQRDADWELIWRHPTQPLKMMRVRPIDITRQRSSAQLLRSEQKFVLRAADPRHYSAIEHVVPIPVTPTNGDPVLTAVTNIGNTAAYPTITVRGPTSGPPVTGIELVNQTGLVTFNVQLTLPTGSVLVGDMDARITGAPRSVITLDGQSKYGSWQLPRDPFHINADPAGLGGFNSIYLRTTPVGAPVVCTLTYRDTWAG
jgi:hypothetical protein